MTGPRRRPKLEGAPAEGGAGLVEAVGRTELAGRSSEKSLARNHPRGRRFVEWLEASGTSLPSVRAVCIFSSWLQLISRAYLELL